MLKPNYNLPKPMTIQSTRSLSTYTLPKSSYIPFKSRIFQQSPNSPTQPTHLKKPTLDYLSLIAPKRETLETIESLNKTEESREELLEMYHIKELILLQEKKRKVLFT